MVKSYFAGDRLVARFDGTTYKGVALDGSRNVKLVLDAWNLTQLEAYDYRAFGAPLTSWVGASQEPFGFAGARVDRELGLADLGARTYDPASGQFLSADSVVPSLARPQSLNRYSYVENDPINYWDPSGHMRLSVELRKERIEQEPGVPTVAASLARILGLGWASIDRGMTMDQALKIQVAYYQAAHPPPAAATAPEAAAEAPGTSGKGAGGPGLSIPGNLLAMAQGGIPVADWLPDLRVGVSKGADAAKELAACLIGGGSDCFKNAFNTVTVEVAAGPVNLETQGGKLVGGGASVGVASVGLDASAQVTTTAEVSAPVGPVTVSAGVEAKTTFVPNGSARDGNTDPVIAMVKTSEWISARVKVLVNIGSVEVRRDQQTEVGMGMPSAGQSTTSSLRIGANQRETSIKDDRN